MEITSVKSEPRERAAPILRFPHSKYRGGGGDLWEPEVTYVDQAALPQWESDLIEDAIRQAEARRDEEREQARKRAVQLAREQAYHRLAVEIDRPKSNKVTPGQLSFFPTPTLFDEVSDDT